MTDATTDSKVGILIMAHGGGTIWNSMVKDAAQPLVEDYPVAFVWGWPISWLCNRLSQN